MGEVREFCSDSNPVMETLVYRLRNPTTLSEEFERDLRKVGRYLGYELAKTLSTEERPIVTVMGERAHHRLLSERPVIVGVVRAGVTLMEGIREAIPQSYAGFVAAARDEVTLKALISYNGVPSLENRTLIAADTMLATGGSMLDTINRLVEENGQPSRIIIASVFATPQGISRVHGRHPDADIYTAVIDPILNDDGYIVPGCGDAGDRLFGEKHE